MAKLSISWRTTTNIAPQAVTTGDTEAQSAKKAMWAEKPMMIYVTADDPTDKLANKLESVVFADERLCIGSKFFDTIKVGSGDAAQDRILKDAGRHDPRIVLISREHKVSKVLQGKQLSAGKILKAMKALVRKEYVNNFDKMVRGYTKLLNDLDRLESQKALLADQRRRLTDKPNKSREKKIARDEKKYEAAMKKWQESEKDLLSLRTKGEKPAT